VPGRVAHFFAELRRRRVFTFAAGYIVTAWVGIEVASVVLQAFEAPLLSVTSRITEFVPVQYGPGGIWVSVMGSPSGS